MITIKAVTYGIGSIINVLLPNECIFCSGIVEEGCCICRNCLGNIPVIDGNFCARCGAPLHHQSANDNHSCYQCRDLGFVFQRNESIGIFNGKLRKLIHLFKFEGRRSLFRTFAGLMLAHKYSYIKQHEVFVPIPLSRMRYSERGFNQSYLIGKGISKKVTLQFLGEAVVRKGRAQPQSSILSLKERRLNMTDRFIVRKGKKDHIAGRNVLLIDDVLTTGATASACAQALYSAGAGNVDLLTMARAVKEPVLEP